MSTDFMDLLKMPKQEAILILADEYKKTGDFPTLRNLNLFLADTKQWQFVKENCEFIIKEEDFTCASDYIKIGMTDWFMGNESSAIDFWKQACDAEYTDSIGPINGPLMLWYAGRRLVDSKLVKQSLKKLKKFWKITDYRKVTSWPGTQAIAGFLLAEVPINDFINKWYWSSGSLEDRRLCRVNFWAGMTLIETSTEKAVEHFKKSFSGGKIAILEYEYFLAKWEYSKFTGEDVWEDGLLDK